MRGIHLSNENKRDSVVAFEGHVIKETIDYVLEDNSPRLTVRVLESTDKTNIDGLMKRYGELSAVGEALISKDPEFDPLTSGMILDEVKKVYVDKEGKVAYSVRIEDVRKDPHGVELSRKPADQIPANINSETPLSWTGKMIPKEKAAKMFVFSRKYQIKHVDGLSFDFLYAMAKELHEKKGVMLLGAGGSGNESLVFTAGGAQYKGFLEGRIDGKKYLLILHLTNLELKEFTGEAK